MTSQEVLTLFIYRVSQAAAGAAGPRQWNDIPQDRMKTALWIFFDPSTGRITAEGETYGRENH